MNDKDITTETRIKEVAESFSTKQGMQQYAPAR